ncbi:ATP-binding protein [Patulibacter medicamentivorans]|uniref:ATP-binding protein n=1 Tax=Patulibacter medicamentivorans TaxID=1097667 RepID=UPI000682CEF1|nr:AAA family ATPase [Patulibacter medicamentivorans]
MSDKNAGRSGKAAKRRKKKTPSATRNEQTGETASACYEYVGSGGERVGRVVRRADPKRFFQERWDSVGERYAPGLNGAELPLFRLPAVRKAVSAGEEVYVVEGEKDVLAAERAGVVATTNPGGAGKWQPRHTEALRDAKKVVIVVDRDVAGKSHARHVASELGRMGVPTRVVRPRPMQKGADLSDHLSAGYSLDDLRPIRLKAGADAAPEQRGEEGAKERPLPAVVQLLIQRSDGKARATGKGWQVICPAHADQEPSLSVGLGDSKPVVVHCHAGCHLNDIADALGVDPREFSRPLPGDAREQEVERLVEQLEVRREAERRIAFGATGIAVELPPLGETLADALEAIPAEPPWAIEGLLPEDGNAVLAAQFKVGKTTMLQDLVAAWVDGRRFLGRFKMRPLTGRIAVVDYEMGTLQGLSWWRRLGIENPKKVVAPVFLRGQQLNLADPVMRAALVEWLRGSEVEVLILDPAARAMRPTVEDENSNSQVGIWTDLVDEVKRLAGVREVIVATHLGKSGNSTRGASRLSDWPDALWSLANKAGGRYFSAEGRDVHVPETRLVFNKDLRRLSTDCSDALVSTVRKTLLRDGDANAREAVRAVAEAGEKPAPRAVRIGIQGNKQAQQAALRDATARGLVEQRYRKDDALVRPEDGRRPNEGRYWLVTEAGHQMLAADAE